MSATMTRAEHDRQFPPRLVAVDATPLAGKLGELARDACKQLARSILASDEHVFEAGLIGVGAGAYGYDKMFCDVLAERVRERTGLVIRSFPSPVYGYQGGTIMIWAVPVIDWRGAVTVELRDPPPHMGATWPTETPPAGVQIRFSYCGAPYWPDVGHRLAAIVSATPQDIRAVAAPPPNHTDFATEKAQVEEVFGLTGGELSDTAYRWYTADGVENIWWNYEGTPDGFECDYGDYDDVFTAVECELYGECSCPPGYERIAEFRSHGETQCRCDYDHDTGEDTGVFASDCPLCEGDGNIYIGDGWGEIVFGKRAAPEAEELDATEGRR